MTDERSRVLPILVLSQVFISATYLMAKLGLREFTPLTLGFIRFLLAGAVFVALLAAGKTLRLPDREDRWTFFWLALLAVPLNQGLFLYGMKYALASHGALLYSTTPIMVLCLSSLFLGERPTPLKISGIALGFAGVVVVLLDQGLAWSARGIKGDLLLLVAVLTWALYTIISKRLLKKYPPLFVTGTALLWGSLLFVPAGLPAALRQDYSAVTGAGIGALLYIALITSVAGYLIWSWGLSRLEASKVTVVSNLQPILAALLAWLFLGEQVTIRFALGAAIVLIGVYLTERG